MNELGVKVLDRMIELLSRPNGWTQRTYARKIEDETPVPTHVFLYMDNVDGVCFCQAGARQRAIRELVPRSPHDRIWVGQEVRDLINAVLIPHGYTDGVTFNDDPSTTQEDVLAVLREARAKLAPATT